MRTAILFVFTLSPPLHASSDLQQYVEANLPTKNHVKQIEWHREKYWVKMADPSKGWLSCFGKKIGSWLTPDIILTPTADCGTDMLATEAKRLKICEKKQGHCSRLILQDKNWILVTDVGLNMEMLVRHTPTDQRSDLILKGLKAITELHKKGIVQGRASLKDLTQTKSGEIYFIDLAENPEESMSFDEACARDYINYFMTSLTFIPQESEQKFAKDFMNQIPEKIKPLINRSLSNLSWLGTLANWIDAFSGRDIRKFARTYRVLKSSKVFAS
ncbi:MAG: hypothetical protein KF820_01800 [Candidatus Paracaedibacteraceae bacterium]|nr:hypothetical protein [Candidatus Paracaedibacteraceae bacterium]